MPGSLDHFTTARLAAERLTREHMPEVFSQDQDERFMALIGGVRTEAETNRRFDGAFKHWDEHGFGVWLLRDRETNAIIGRAVLRHLTIEGGDELEIGYAFREAWWGRGLATEIARGIVDLARRELGRTSFVALTDPRHDASRHVLEKAGFAYAGKHTQEGDELNLFRLAGNAESR